MSLPINPLCVSTASAMVALRARRHGQGAAAAPAAVATRPRSPSPEVFEQVVVGSSDSESETEHSGPPVLQSPIKRHQQEKANHVNGKDDLEVWAMSDGQISGVFLFTVSINC